MVQKSGAQAYQQINQQSTVPEANPHRLIQMLMEGALNKIEFAKGYMQNKDIEKKGVQISLAISIIDGLKASLDTEKGGEVAQNLNDLYMYMMDKLVEANLNDDTQILDEVHQLMQTIKEGWDGIEQKADSPQQES